MATAAPTGLWRVLGTKVLITLAVAVVATAASAVLTFGNASSVLTFIVAAIALAALASVVGDGTEQLGARLGPGATGVLQSALGNLPELFIAIFALREGLVKVVQAALVGSILGNSLLVLGLAFVVGGVRHGRQRFASETPRLIAIMTLVSVASVLIPTMAAQVGSPAAHHELALSVVVAIVLLVIFAGSVTYILRGGDMGVTTPVEEGEGAHALWPMWLAIALLAVAAVGAAFVSDWFVTALRPATESLGISEGFTGLVIVAVAGNAVENVVGIQFAGQNRSDLAVSVILNSSLQVALALIPALVLLSLVVGGAHLTLVLSPLLVAALALTAVVGAVIVYDGESTWIEGMALIGLYVIIAAAFWWG
jgi:Ca2+:H+ antiporter